MWSLIRLGKHCRRTHMQAPQHTRTHIKITQQSCYQKMVNTGSLVRSLQTFYLGLSAQSRYMCGDAYALDPWPLPVLVRTTQQTVGMEGWQKKAGWLFSSANSAQMCLFIKNNYTHTSNIYMCSILLLTHNFFGHFSKKKALRKTSNVTLISYI